MILSIWDVQKKEIHRDTKCRFFVVRGCEDGVGAEWDLSANEYGFSFWSNENVWKLYYDDGSTALKTYLKDIESHILSGCIL